jgi:hypothetical protein
VNAKVVENHMNPRSQRIASEKFLEQTEEQQAVLLRSAHPRQPSTLGIQRAGQVAFLVLAGRKNLILRSPVHPVQADLWVEMEPNRFDAEKPFVQQEKTDFYAPPADDKTSCRFSPGDRKAIPKAKAL